MLRAEVYAHAMRASQNRKKEVRREKEAKYFQPSLKFFSVFFCIEESPSLLRLLGAPSQKPPLLLWCDPGVAPGRP